MTQSRAFPFVLGLILSISAIILAMLVGGDHDTQANLAARWTSRVGLPLFLIAYLASSLRRVWKNDITKAIMQRRRQWGLAFAMTHTIHLAALSYYLLATDESRTLISLIPGGLAYALLYLMAFTSNNAAQKKLGRRWKTLHAVGIHWLWFIFFASYAGRLFNPDLFITGVWGTMVMVAALGFRIWSGQKRKRAAT